MSAFHASLYIFGKRFIDLLEIKINKESLIVYSIGLCNVSFSEQTNFDLELQMKDNRINEVSNFLIVVQL